jgi:hypothetical protein
MGLGDHCFEMVVGVREIILSLGVTVNECQLFVRQSSTIFRILGRNSCSFGEKRIENK